LRWYLRCPPGAQQSPFAIISDKDGYTNIRSGKNRTMIDRLYSNQVFAVRSVVDEDGWQDWYWIDYPDYKTAESLLKNISKKRGRA
jgi:hypothetical protein